MPAASPWHVRPNLLDSRFAFFLSHVSEDKPDIESLKGEVERRLAAAGSPQWQCFYDAADWSRASPPLDVIEAAAFESIHMLLWVTPAYLRSSKRGWAWVEFTLGHLIDRSREFDAGRARFTPYLVPVFRGVSLRAIGRTPLTGHWGRGFTRPGEDVAIPAVAAELARFFLDERANRERADTPSRPRRRGP